MESLLDRLSRTSVPAHWHAEAANNIFYRVSPFFFLALLTQLARSPAYRLEHLECLLHPVVAVFSYASDVHTLGRYSRWHAADRLLAYGFSAWVVGKVFLLSLFAGAYTPGQRATTAVTLTAGIWQISASWRAVRRRSCVDFLRRHALWHCCFPIGMVVFNLQGARLSEPG